MVQQHRYSSLTSFLRYGNQYQGADDFEGCEIQEQDEIEIENNMSTEEGEQPIYQVQYTIKTIDKLVEIQAETIKHIANLLNTNLDNALLLLYHFKWDSEKLIDVYLESPEETLQKITGKANTVVSISSCRQCNICFSHCQTSEMTGASCGHRFCIACFTCYTNGKIKENYIPFIKCPQYGCQRFIEDTVLRPMLMPDIKMRYQTLLIQNFVSHSTFLKWCTAPDCKFAIECHISENDLKSIVPTVHCQCGHSMCFGCDVPDHQPATCSLVKKWLKKSREDNESVNWIANNTKDCINCHTAIEKNGGCNHMTCWKCNYHFCWICLGDWNRHSQYACNRYLVDASDTKSATRRNIERYLHYYQRYKNHEQSAKFEKAVYAKAEQNMTKLQLESNLSWNEAQFLKHAVETIVKCRNTLKWTYAFVYYLKESNEKTLFEDNQENFEVATEQLSELLERPIEKENSATLRQMIIDKTVYVSQRQSVLLDHATQGLQDGIWLFDFDVYC
ncbi:hypothetical protein EDC96DRAFT_521574 [Choanephora cucurbitarum]|nr:hypothetical protein EDC96DRAFT_521574 [Choanephora cucurbitarum]